MAGSGCAARQARSAASASATRPRASCHLPSASQSPASGRPELPIEFDGTFGGWAWQVWGGLAIPLSGQGRLTGEVFVNNGEAHRDVDGPPGITYRETVNLDGTGARFGVNFGF